ncbi:hypothetical protein VRU48_05320 [Pedobacter sp. KR3-3]|uniref:CHRD domain-containing protein n=1 Tax=Pedobacter albus TaxID=3113905 RepID=A0ABU7I4Y2_9SPHI|nr:hypothetical protein [Pedobacter sp. KR3-3]MEE1944518.1 hypothetical protein [Pedobacter sp. KR3-3]
MKNYFYLMMAVCTLFFTACKKNTDSPEEPATGGGSATLTASNYGVDGTASGKFSATKAGITQTTVAGVTTFAISAIKDGSNESINIIVPRKITATGKITFVYNDSSNGGITFSKDYTKPADGALNYKTDAFNSTTKGGGELNITKLDGSKIEGTFYFVAINANGKEAWAENGAFSGTIK